MTESPSDVVLLERLSAGDRRIAPCLDVSLVIPQGSIHALIGRDGSGLSAVVGCLLGRLRPSAGRLLVLGQEPWRHRRRLGQQVWVVPPEKRIRASLTVGQLRRRLDRHASIWDDRGLDQELARVGVAWDQQLAVLTPSRQAAILLALAFAAKPRLLILNRLDIGPDAPERRALLEQIRSAPLGDGAVLLAARDPRGIEAIADAVSFLRRGRLVVSDRTAALQFRFRRIRYRNEMVAARVDYGTELDEFEAARVRVRGWGVEAIVSNFDEERFQRFLQIPGISDVEMSSLTLEEIFDAVG